MEDLANRKKFIGIYILLVLHKHASKENRLRQADIINFLRRDYGIEVDRKTIQRNIDVFPADIAQIKKERGYYIEDPVFTPAQLRVIADAVLSSPYLSTEQANEILCGIKKIAPYGFDGRKKQMAFADRWNRTPNKEVFRNIDVIDEAIENERQICFAYNKFDADGLLQKTREHTVSPYQMIVKNQRYYLLAYNEKYKNMGFYHIDHITGAEISEKPRTQLRTISGYQSGIEYEKISACLPYMFADPPQRVKFYIFKDIFMENEVVEWFGKQARFTAKDDKILVEVTASVEAMKHWAMQYIDAIEIVEPDRLRKEIAKIAEDAYNRHK